MSVPVHSILRHSPSPDASACQESHRAGFTLVELLTVIIIIGILATIVIASISPVRSTARRTRCVANLRQFGAAAALYSQDNKFRTVPPHFYWALTENGYLPVLTLGDMHAKAGVWMCPGDPADRTAVTTEPSNADYVSYGINTQNTGLPPDYWKTSKSMLGDINRPSRTLHFADAKVGPDGMTKWWIEKPAANRNASFHHQGKVNVVFFDGHAATLEKPSSLDDFYNDYF
ncbi:MAG: prepilin-type N-terminal cleavage/methylation domain-containing protein [Opitutaceae bacterium]|nr:prepilin-type N-terminal cleavage/methylation domain-containing protein [Opitutaceae bacterium]